MRLIFLKALIVLILTSCSEKEALTFDEELQKLSDKSQTFAITNDQADTIVTKNGTRIIIRPKTFVFHDGQDAKELIKIELREVFDRSDMILNGLGTVSDGRLLESFGMIYLRATSGDRELKIRDNESIALSIANKREGFSGELFYGSESNSQLNWEYAGATTDTTEVIETIIPMSDGLASIKRTTYKFVNGLREFVSDTLFIIKYECCLDSVEEVVGDTVYYIPKFYEFELTNLGWINCDRFIDIINKVDLDIELKNFSQPIGYIVFNDINSVVEVLFNAQGKAIVLNLPKNYQADLVILDKIKDNFMWTKQEIRIGTDSRLTLETKKIKEDELKVELKKIDK